MMAIGYVLKTIYVNQIEWYYAALIMLGSGILNLFMFKIIEIKNIRKLLLER
jgi:hypothetical protein